MTSIAVNTLAPADIQSQAREAMVVSQLQPSGIITESVMNAYRAVPRENFVPRDRADVCYIDETMDLGNGKYLLEPLIHGLLVEHADIQPSDKILVVGDLTGYSAAILRHLCGDVSEAPTLDDVSSGAPFDVIIVNGAVAEVPAPIFAALALNGRLTCVLCPNPKQMGRVTVFTKLSENNIVERTVKDGNAPYIKGCEAKIKFSL